MIRSILLLLLFLFSISSHWSYAQEKQISANPTEELILNLSKEKWKWMADKNVDKLASIFHDKSKFVHMSGTWKKDEELEIIKSGSIWYKNAAVHDTALELFDNTAILWSRVTLLALVRGNEVTTEFTVTEVFKKEGEAWKILALTFSSVRDTHTIKH